MKQSVRESKGCLLPTCHPAAMHAPHCCSPPPTMAARITLPMTAAAIVCGLPWRRSSRATSPSSCASAPVALTPRLAVAMAAVLAAVVLLLAASGTAGASISGKGELSAAASCCCCSACGGLAAAAAPGTAAVAGTASAAVAAGGSSCSSLRACHGVDDGAAGLNRCTGEG